MKKTITLVVLFLIIVSASVNAQWSDDPEQNLEVVSVDYSATKPKIAHDESGNYYIGFYSTEDNNYNIRLQRLDKDGNYLWAEEGILVSSHEQASWIAEWALDVDHDGNCIIAFSDVRNVQTDIFAYKISSDGDFLWGEDGINIGTEDEEFGATLCVLDDNSVIVAWEYLTMIPSETQMHRILSDGTLAWGENGITYGSGGEESCSGARVTPSGNDFILTYYRETGPSYAVTRHIYAQKLNENGEAIWPQDVLVSDDNGISGWTNLNVISDKNGGVIIGWHDDMDSDMIFDGKVQQVKTDGSMTFPEGGVEVATIEAFNHNDVFPAGITEDGSIEVAFNYSDHNQNNKGVKAQKIDIDGNLSWGTSGYFVLENNGEDAHLVGATSFGDTLYVSYQVSMPDPIIGTQLFAKAIDSDGNNVWEEDALISSRETSRPNTAMTDIINDQLVVAWEDAVESNKIFAQNLNLDGSIGDNTSFLNYESLKSDYSISIYPNPASDILNIESNHGLKTVKIFSISGQVIKEFNSPNQTINLHDIKDGLYILSVITVNGNCINQRIEIK